MNKRNSLLFLLLALVLSACVIDEQVGSRVNPIELLPYPAPDISPPLEQKPFEIISFEEVTYLPLIGEIEGSTPSIVENCIAWGGWGRRQPLDHEVLGVDCYLVWSPTYGSPMDGVDNIPYISCDSRPYAAFGDDVEYQQLDKVKELYPEIYPGYFLLFNEPDLRGQCGMSAYRAAMMTRKIREDFPYAKLVGPAVSHLDYENNWVWLREYYLYMEYYNIRRPEVQAIHTYIDYEHPQQIINDLDAMLVDFPGTTNRFWITEFGTRDSELLDTMLTTYKNDDRVERWFYFAPRLHDDPYAPGLDDFSLFVDNSSYELSELGEVWVSHLRESKHDKRWIQN